MSAGRSGRIAAFFCLKLVNYPYLKTVRHGDMVILNNWFEMHTGGKEMSVYSSEEMLLAHDGIPLHSQLHLHSHHKGVVVLLHGYAEHCGRYQHVIQHMNAHGLSVYAFDQRSHGRSPGTRGMIPSIDSWINDVDMMMDRVLMREAGKPVFIMGHGAGALVAALYYAERRPDIAGLILSAIPLRSETSPMVGKLTSLTARLFPSFPLSRTNHPGVVSHDEQVCDTFLKDPLCHHGKVVAKTHFELKHAADRLHSQLSRIDCPVLIMHGTGDKCVSPECSRILHENAMTDDKTLYQYDGFYHEIFNEVGRDRVLGDLSFWIDDRCNISPPKSSDASTRVSRSA